MATGTQVWSQTPVTNATADSNVNWAEGMAPSAVNDSARAVMSSVAKWRDDNNGTVVTSGTTSAMTVVTNQVEGALTDGYTISVLFSTAPDTNATLAVDGLAAKPMQTISGSNVINGQFVGGQIQRFTYSSTGTGQWIANGLNPNAGLVNQTGTLGAATVLNSTNYVDAVSLSISSSTATWFASGVITVTGASGAGSNWGAKIWDGVAATFFAAGAGEVFIGGFNQIVLSSIFTTTGTAIKMSGNIPLGGTSVTMQSTRLELTGLSRLNIIRIG